MDALTVSVLTLVATIIGWFITWHRQGQILERQIKAEKERDARQILVPTRLDRLRELRAWFHQGIKLLTSKVSGIPTSESEGVNEWLLDSFELMVFAASIEGMSPAEAIEQEDTLAKMVETFLNEAKRSMDRRELTARIDVYEKAIARIDALEEKIAKPG
jgi:hypothetical protein